MSLFARPLYMALGAGTVLAGTAIAQTVDTDALLSNFVTRGELQQVITEYDRANVEPLREEVNRLRSEQTPVSTETSGRCGDGIVQYGEQCDDDNLRSNDGCSSRCIVEQSIPGYPESPVPGGSFCGDNICDKSEARAVSCPVCRPGTPSDQCHCSFLCEQDCGSNIPAPTTPVYRCGDGICSSNEQSIFGTSCPIDCGGSIGRCGDGRCEASEEGFTTGSCPLDCGSTMGGPRCGDNVCDVGEQGFGSFSCPSDCAASGHACGNGICDAGEEGYTTDSCPVDCRRR